MTATLTAVLLEIAPSASSNLAGGNAIGIACDDGLRGEHDRTTGQNVGRDDVNRNLCIFKIAIG